MAPMNNAALTLEPDAIASFCKANGKRKLSLFGSALRGDFGVNSDVDILVEFEPGEEPSLIGMARMQRELSAVIGRDVDLRTPEDLSRHFRDEVVASAETQYVAA